MGFIDARNRGVVAHHRAEVGSSIAQGDAQRSHASFDLGCSLKTEHFAHEPMQIGKNRVGGSRPHGGSDHRIQREGRLQLRRLKGFLHNVKNVDQDQTHQVAHVVFAQ